MWTSCTLNRTYGAKLPPASVVQKFGEGMSAQVSSRCDVVSQNICIVFSSQIAKKVAISLSIGCPFRKQLPQGLHRKAFCELPVPSCAAPSGIVVIAFAFQL
ncbi:hypothetical protein AVEN_124115-1 [Araneus ventricosus]|uniref:Uncharacterized protein n=1 Tax=Araneus ventricosus TaxID=182803 RepID=A0A4Y2HYQ3_ARAVE|nr:hypothetical protein AVEN_124115-1 [Araneus ventricosus]